MSDEERKARDELLLDQKVLTKGAIYFRGKAMTAYLLGVVPGIGNYSFYFSLPTYSEDFYRFDSYDDDWRFEVGQKPSKKVDSY